MCATHVTLFTEQANKTHHGGRALVGTAELLQDDKSRFEKIRFSTTVHGLRPKGNSAKIIRHPATEAHIQSLGWLGTSEACMSAHRTSSKE